MKYILQAVSYVQSEMEFYFILMCLISWKGFIWRWFQKVEFGGNVS